MPGVIAVSGQFFGLPYNTLVTLLNAYTLALTQIATAGQSHAVTGRSFTMANISEVRQTIAELQAAINQNQGVRVRRTLAAGGGFTP